MATEIKQGVKYVIEAEDKATRTAEKAAENVKQSADKVAKSAAATAEAGKKSLGGVNIVAEGLRAGLSRIGGGLGNLVPIFSKAGAAGAAAFGVIGLAVQAIYSAIKTLGALISSVLGSDLDKQLTQTRDHIAQINHDMEEMEHGMEQAEARANRAAEARNLELDAIERMTKAQIEYNRQQALALANTEKEKQAVNDLYDEKAAEAQEESRSAERQARRERLENELARQQEARRKTLHWAFILLGAAIVVIFVLLALAGSPYLNWNYSDPETAVAGTALHAFEFLFVRIAPFVLVGAVAGAVLTWKRK